MNGIARPCVSPTPTVGLHAKFGEIDCRWAFLPHENIPREHHLFDHVTKILHRAGLARIEYSLKTEDSLARTGGAIRRLAAGTFIVVIVCVGTRWGARMERCWFGSTDWWAKTAARV